MPTIESHDGTEIFYKDWGSGQPIVFSHGWPLSADDWDAQLLFFLHHGYRVIAHDRRGHGRSSQTADGHDVDHYADDLAALVTKTPFAKSWCGQPLTVWMDGAVEHEADHGEGDHGLGHLGQVLVVPGQAAPAAEPAECPLDDPAAGQHGEALCSRWTADDDQHEAEQEAGEQGCHAVVGAICKHGAQPAIQWLDAPKRNRGKTPGLIAF